MTEAQQLALAALAGRPLTDADVAAIEPLLPERRDDLIAAVLSEGRTRLVSMEITPRGSAAAFPAVDGLPGPLALQKALRKLTAFAAAAKQSSNEQASLLGDAIEEQLAGYRTRGLDFSVRALRDMLDMIAAAGGISVAEAEGFKSLATQPHPLTTNEVSDALNRAEGRLTLGG